MDTPTWITELLERNNLMTVHKFSKFIHGCVTLFPDKVKLLPTWLPLLEQRSDKDPLYATFLKVEHATKTIPKRQPSPKEKPKGEIQVITETPPEKRELRKRFGVFEKKANEVELESASLLINETPAQKPLSPQGGGGKPPQDPWWKKPWNYFLAWKNKKPTQSML
jgi:hypothetical protein